jgi:hypothetical protein
VLILDGVTADGAKNTYRVEVVITACSDMQETLMQVLLYDASYVKLREASLTYNLPRTLLADSFIQGLSVSLVGSNLWIIHKNLPYADPEAGQSSGNIQGWQSGVMPTTRNIGFSLKLQF